ncbi:MAG: hypothetical protein KAI79_18515 [Bacteroidales bacterium]|nr:hypothetical protein [Bacteroidales bacterium]
MTIKIKTNAIELNSSRVLFTLLVITGFIAFLVSFYFPENFRSKNPNFMYVWIYSALVLLILGGFIEIYQRRNSIIFMFSDQTIYFKELYSGKRNKFSIHANLIKEFHLYQRYESNTNQNKYKYELHIVDLKNNNFVLAELHEIKKLQDLVEKLSTNFDKDIHIFSQKEDIQTNNNIRIKFNKEYHSEFWLNRISEFESNLLIKENKKNFICKKEEQYEQISWSYKQQAVLALISSLLGIGLVLIFSMIIIPLKGYNIAITIGLITSFLFLLISLLMLIYTSFAKSYLYIYPSEIKFEINFFRSVVFSQKVSRENVLHIAGSFDSVKRNELILLSEKGFELLYKRNKNTTEKINGKLLEKNILIIDTRPLLSANRYFLYGKLHKILK